MRKSKIWQKFRVKLENLKFRTKNISFGYLGMILKKIIIIFEISTLKFVKKKIKKNQVKPKKIKFGSKILVVWEYLGQNLKNITIFVISALDFFKLQSFVQKKKFLHFGPKMPYLSILCRIFEKLLSHLKSVPPNLADCKFRGRIKFHKFGTKNA